MQTEKIKTPKDGETISMIDSNTNAVSVQEREEMAWEFLFTLFASVPKDKPHFSYLWLLSQDKTKKITIPFDVTNYDAKDEIAKQAIKFNDEGYNIFFGVNLTDKPMSEHERPHEEDITIQTAVVADLDCVSAWHYTDKKDYPIIEQAEKFLPFEPSILVNSGGGLHSYVMFENPLHFNTDEERKQAVSRNKDYIEMIRQNAGEFAGAVDSVHDLPRVLRLPGTYNLKQGRENAPLCERIKYGLVYHNDNLRELIKPRTITPAKKPQKSTVAPTDTLIFNGSTEYDIARAAAMLAAFSPAVLTYDEWLHIGMALKTNGNTCADWEEWSRQDPEKFKVGECESKWRDFNRTDLTIATIHDMAKKYGNYNEKDFRREHPEFKSAAPSDSLEDKLRDVNKAVADFEREKSVAIEKIKSLETFDQATVLADKENVKAAAFCKLFDKNTFLKLKSDIQNQIKLQKSDKFINDWIAEVRDKATEIKSREKDLLSQKKSINAKIVSSNFIATHDELKDFVIPEGYEISKDGISKIVGDKSLTVSRTPAVIKCKLKNVEDKTFKYILAYLSENDTWQSVPATNAAIVFNSRKLIDLADFGFPVTSSNANLFVDFLDAYRSTNEKILPMSLNVSRCGWHKLYGTDYFIDPRRNNFISDEERQIEIVVDDSITFAKSLKSKGSIDEWRKAYDLAKNSPVARLIVAAAVAPPLLNLLGERNFMLYIHATTRAGKSTALKLAASAIGNEKIIRSFDGTKNGLAGAAADVNDYAFLLDEKQVADSRLKDQFTTLVYALANGVGRTKLNKDSSLKKTQDWRTIVIANGETELLDDNATGGAFTRLLQIHAPKTILDSDTCAKIRSIIRDNYGLALPLVIDKIWENREFLKNKYDELVNALVKAYSQYLPDYLRYIAIISLADCMLDVALFGQDKYDAYEDAIDFAETILSFVPTNEDISDFEREKNFVLGFIAQNQKYFLGATSAQIENLPYVYGKFEEDFTFITVTALQQACNQNNFDYKKVVADLIDNGFFTPDKKIANGRKKPSQSVLKKISGVNTRCYRISKEKIIADELR